MVAGFQDDVDLEDKPPSRPLPPTGRAHSEDITLSSEEEAEEGAGHPKAAVLAPQKCPEPETRRCVGAEGKSCGGTAGGGGRGEAGSRLGSMTLLGVLRSSTRAAGPPRDAAPRKAEPRRPGGTKARPEGPSRGLEEGTDQPASSESDTEGPIAAQMLSFVMDDPDFESDSDAQRRAVRTSLAPTLPASPGQLGGPVKPAGACRAAPWGAVYARPG